MHRWWCIDGGCSTLELLGDIEGADALVIVDAIAAGKAPGTVVRLEGDDIPAVFVNKMSPHQNGIADMLATMKLLGRVPGKVVAIGMQPERIELDLELSGVVAEKMPVLRAMVIQEVEAMAGAGAGAGERVGAGASR
jgi:hydrogenase maturation protease